MKSKSFSFKGATILVLQDGEMVEFYMNHVTSNYYFCTDYKAKLEDITERDAIRIWNQYSDRTVEDDNALISHYLAKMEARVKQQKTRKKRKKT